jgi:ribokinase
VVLGDLVLDVVVAPARPLEAGTDVAGRVAFVQGGSAATTARWLARLGARSTLVCAVGRDATGRALVDAVRRDGVLVHASRVARARTGRIGVVVTPDGERSFVTDRGAADLLRPADLKASWFASTEVVHVPVYSLLGSPLGDAGRRAIELGHEAGALVSLDLASIGPLMARGRRIARTLIAGVAPDILFATETEAAALLDGLDVDGLLAFSRIAVVKRGAEGATMLARVGGERLRLEVATARMETTDSTGAGDAFDAGFLVGWLAARAAGRSLAVALQRAALSGHRAAARQLSTPRVEVGIG